MVDDDKLPQYELTAVNPHFKSYPPQGQLDGSVLNSPKKKVIVLLIYVFKVTKYLLKTVIEVGKAISRS